MNNISVYKLKISQKTTKKVTEVSLLAHDLEELKQIFDFAKFNRDYTVNYIIMDQAEFSEETTQDIDNILAKNDDTLVEAQVSDLITELISHGFERGMI